ncbi:hypothetical protein BCR42DRAFT_410629 [Absidia repens]|uniref:DH domain-containing protein n=1 Tax=Absidia repens TaxID=90262 RepID=A0A1X2IP86_9FUNG|nr:hypothetical protein BCR42DRAFT_410629 [Absidia repens]
MPGLKTIDGLLKDLGYSSYTPSKEKYLVDDEEDKTLLSQTKLPLGQAIDIIVPNTTRSDQATPFKQLIDSLGTRYIANDHSTSNNSNDFLEHKYKHNDQLRMDRIEEFYTTETSYIRKLEALVNTIVKPLKQSCTKDKPILNKFRCTNIFLNLEQILELHQQFMKDLMTCKDDFATVCSTYMGKMDRYRRYLLKVNDAQELQLLEYQKNQPFRSFIIKAITDPVFKGFSLKMLLDEPWKRITAYTALLKEIRNYTSADHPDFDKLTDSFTQINTIASVRDDVPTILATKSHDLYLSIRKAPCHLIKQSRSLVTHLDAVEINRITGKTSRHVTIFLFCDKIMVASRSSHAKGADICDGVPSGNTPLTNLTPKKKKGHDFKFCGWVELEHIELFHGPSDLPGAIIIRASSDFQDSITETGYEKYFQKGARIFACQTESTRQTLPDFMEHKDAFVDTFYKTQAVARQYGNQDATYYRPWNDLNVYSNVYDHETYIKTDIKNNVATILLEKDSKADISSLLNSSRSSPWIIALVRPDSHGLKLNLWSKVPLSCLHDQRTTISDIPKTAQDIPLDFATVFWNNVIKCERKLRYSSTYRLMNESLDEQEDQRPPRSRSRTSMSRSTSISNISKFFGRSRSQSPFSSMSSAQVVPTSSRSTPAQKQEQQDGNSSTRQRRPRSHSMSSSDPSASDVKQKIPTIRRRKLSASFFKFDIKPPSSSTSSPTSTLQMESKSSQQQRQAPSQLHVQQHQQTQSQNLSFSPKRRQSITSVTTSMVAVSSTCSLPPSVYPTERPSSTVYTSSPDSHQTNVGYAPYSPPVPMTVDSGKQKQLIEKLDAMYYDMTGIRKPNPKEQQQQSHHTSDPLVTRPASRTCSASSASPVSTPSPQLNSHHHHPHQLQNVGNGNFGTNSSRSSSYGNTLSSYASQSSRSSLSLEELDQLKGYGPSPQLVNSDIMSSNTLQHDDNNKNDEITRKAMSDLAGNHKKWLQKSLSSHYTSAIDTRRQHYQQPQQQLPSPTSPTSPSFPTNVAPKATMSMPMLAGVEKEPALDHVATAVDHCSNQVGSKWQFLLDKHRMLGNQVNRVAERLPSDTDAGMLNEVYRDTMDETSSFFNKINTELEEISTIVNTYRQGYQQHQQRRNSSIDTVTPATATFHMNAHEADVLLKRKLKEAQLERDYWHRRASELTNQVNEFALKQ